LMLVMKILIVTQYFWPESFRVNDLAFALRDKGHQVTVLTGIPNYPAGRFYPGYGIFQQVRQIFGGLRIIRVPMLPRGNSRGWQLALNYLSFALSASLFGPLYCRGVYEIIFVAQYSPATVGIPAVILKKLRGTPIMFWIQDLWPESLSASGAVRSQLTIRIIGRLVRRIYESCDQILVQSRGFFSHLEGMGVDSDRVRFFPNWAETHYRAVDAEEDLPEVSSLPAGFRVMFAGNIGASQDFGTILFAAEQLKEYPDIKWLILGDGRMRSWVENEIRKRGLTGNVHLLGRHPIESMPRFFAQADAMLVTLRNEPIFSLTIPGKVQSYLACGRPIIAALDGEGGRVIDEAGAGITCPPENPEALAGAVLKCYRMTRSDRETMGLRGRTYYESHFERQMLLDRLETWMEELSRTKSLAGRA
jgi:glycosyltransferase involved in cell wall biosynthesis